MEEKGKTFSTRLARWSAELVLVFIGVSAAFWLKDRKSTRLNSSHLVISYAVFCLKKKTVARDRRATLNKPSQLCQCLSTQAMLRNVKDVLHTSLYEPTHTHFRAL